MSKAVDVASDIETGIQALKDGGVIAFPTDTLYALGADATNPAAVARVYSIKVREAGKPLPLFVSGLVAAEDIAEVTPPAMALARRFWPGALTMVLRRKASFRSEALAGGETVALRVPDSREALDITRGLGAPVTATSANVSGGPDPTDAQAVLTQVGGRIDLVIDRGTCPIGQPSTIVDCTTDPPQILREGAIGREEIEAVFRGEQG